MPQSEDFDATISPSGRLQIMTVPVDRALSAWIDDVRARMPVENDFRFWASVVRRGLADLDREARLSSIADVKECRATTFAAAPLPTGVSSPSEAVLVPFAVEDLEALAALRPRRPDWSDVVFWRHVLVLGVHGLRQALDREDHGKG